jgi:hypothetical protein
VIKRELPGDLFDADYRVGWSHWGAFPERYCALEGS